MPSSPNGSRMVFPDGPALVHLAPGESMHTSYLKRLRRERRPAIQDPGNCLSSRPDRKEPWKESPIIWSLTWENIPTRIYPTLPIRYRPAGRVLLIAVCSFVETMRMASRHWKPETRDEFSRVFRQWAGSPLLLCFRVWEITTSTWPMSFIKPNRCFERLWTNVVNCSDPTLAWTLERFCIPTGTTVTVHKRAQPRAWRPVALI